MIALDLSLENLYRQYHHCRRNKRNTVNALRFEADQEKNLITLCEDLIDRSYQPRRSVCFFTTRPKFREIIAADFRDRVVHHLLVDYLEQFWEPVFIHDSYACRKGKGLPIGNLNSQFFANVYLNRLDQFVKHDLKCRYYLRYCDDFVLLSHDREQLVAWRERIKTCLRDELKLELNDRQRLAPVSNGIDFLGYIDRRDYLLVRRRVVGHLKAKLRVFEAQLVGAVSSDYAAAPLIRPTDGHRVAQGVRCYCFDEAVLDRLAAVLSSYLGHFKMANTRNLWRSIWRQFNFLSQYFEFDETNWKLIRKYQTPKTFRRVRNQYRYFRWRFPDDVLFFQVGRFMECYDIGTLDWVRRWTDRVACRRPSGHSPRR